MGVVADVGQKIGGSAESRQSDCDIEWTAADMLGGCPDFPFHDVNQRLADDQCPHRVDGTGVRKACTPYNVDWWIATGG